MSQQPEAPVADAELKALYVEWHGNDGGWLGIQGSYFISGVQAARAQVERLQAGGVVDEPTRSQQMREAGFTRRKTGRSVGGLMRDPEGTTPEPSPAPVAQEAADTGADGPEPSQFDSPLSEFQEGQWWVKELDHMASTDATPDQKRAVAVVHHMLRAAARSGQVAAPAMVQLTDVQALDVVWKADKAWRSGPKHSSPFALLVLRETERAHGINGLTVGDGGAKG